jgi:hypothetical protein
MAFRSSPKLRRVTAITGWLLTATGVAACGDAEGVGSPGTSRGGGGQGGAVASAGSAGSAGQAGAPVGGAAQGGAPSAGSPGQGGAGSPSAGGGAGGGSGSAGAAGAPVDDRAALAALDHFQLLDPCDLTSYKVEASPGAVCPQANDVKNQHVTRQLAGDPNVTYAVKLRVRGIVERYWYEGGQLDQTSKAFYTGGLPSIGGFSSACKNKASELPFTLPSELTPEGGCFNGFNVFALAVSEPKQHYYLNYTTDKDGDRPPHAVYALDYTVDLKLKGGAKLDFYVIGSDEHQCYNHDQVLDGVQLPSSPYIGEFLQFDVLEVMREPALGN